MNVENDPKVGDNRQPKIEKSINLTYQSLNITFSRHSFNKVSVEQLVRRVEPMGMVLGGRGFESRPTTNLFTFFFIFEIKEIFSLFSIYKVIG